MKPTELDTSGGGGILRRLQALEESNHELQAEVVRLRESVNTVDKSVNTVGNRILYAVAAGALAFAFSVLQLVG